MQVSSDSRLGTTVENYRLLSVLGTGSMSVVYLAQRLDDPRVLVAIKILHPQAASAPDERAAFRQRFLREARAASKLRNEYILPVLSSGDVDGMPYMVLPVIVGGTLGMRLASQPEPMPLGEVARYLTQLASAIDYAHQQGVIHRDIKPANILLDEHGHVYLTDFGIARLFDSGENALTRESPQTLTRTGQVLGTPYYMAPEQIRGQPVSAAADIYALGVVLYQLVTGQVPFHGDTPLAVALQHLQEEPSPPGLLRHELPAPLEAVILQALAKDPEDRYATATELADAFQAGLAELDDPMATQAPTETWPFSTIHALRASTIAATPAANPMSPTRALFEKLATATIDGYHIGAIIESNELGTVFTAYRAGSAEPDQLRFLPIPPDTPPQQIADYLHRFEQQAGELAQLRHPNLVPVLGYGFYERLPYLITTDPPGRSLSIELAQHGAAELSAIADFLDQAVAALEYAHQRGILHLSLTPDCLFRQDDGSILVADIGIRGMLEQDEAPSGQHPLYVNSDGGAPEQLLGNPVGPYTDVYALGAVLYQMLTGHEVFTGATRDDIAQQHLHSTIPPLRRWRPNLPTALDRVVARAMAKEPKHRFQSPRDLAVAYRAAIAQTQSEATFDGSLAARASHYQSLTTPASAGAASQGLPMQSAQSVQSARSTPVPAPSEPVPAERKVADAAEAPAGSAAATVVRPPIQTPRAISTRLRTRTGIAFMLGVVLLVALTVGSFAWYNGHSASGQPVAAPTAAADVKFLDNTKNGPYQSDALAISVTNLPSLQQGHWYQAWLINDKTEKVLALGKLIPQSRQSKTYTLTYAGDGSPGNPGTNLLGFGNRVRITDETQNGPFPAGPVMLEGAYPPGAFVHIQHLLVAFPTTPQHQGLVVGTMQQMNLLYQQANVLQQWITLHYPISTKCAAQSVLDIIEGKSGQNYKPLGAECNIVQQWPSGDGYGLLGKDGYLAGVADHAALAASAPDATEHIRMHAQHVQIAVENMKGWLQTVDQDAVKVLAGTGDTTTTTEIVSLSKTALTGQDIDGDESVDPVKGEAGADIAYTHAQLLALLSFTAHA